MGGSYSKEDGRKYGVQVGSDATEGGGPVYRHKMYKDQLVESPHHEVKTLHDNFQFGLKISAQRPCLGYRPVANGTAGPYTWITYEQVWKRVLNFGSGIETLGLSPKLEFEGVGQMRTLGIYSKNRVEWVVAEQACNAFGVVTVPLYDTLGPDTVQFVINEAELVTVVCGSAKEAATVLEVSPQCPTLKFIVIADGKVEASSDTLRVLNFAEVEAIGAGSPVEPNHPKPDDVATFCYTSGTTGNPKGAMLTHRNIMSVIGSAVFTGIRTCPDDVHLSYLPLAHMFERVVEAIMWFGGGAVGFYQGDPKFIMDDLKCLRPTLFPSVPRLYNKIYDTILQKVGEKGGFSAKMFHYGLSVKEHNLRNTGAVSSLLYDSLVFNKVRASLGLDRVRLMLTGSAPIAPHVMEFLRAAFACHVCEGYGATETGGASSVTEVDDQSSLGHVGGPLPCCEICLVEVPEMGYKNSDKKHGEIAVEGRGEVCVRGPNIFKGYFKNPEKTAEAIDEHGWYHTGDIGVWTPEGTLKIVDRKKNIFKLAQGEYVAAEKLENVFAKSQFVEQIFVYGNSFHTFVIAIVFPTNAAVSAFFQNQGKDVPPLEVACKNEELRKAVLTEMVQFGKESKLNSYELPKDLLLTPTPFSVENGTLTPTFKLKRKEAQELYQREIDGMYEKEKIGGQSGGLKQGA